MGNNIYVVLDSFDFKEAEYNSLNEAYKHASEIEGIILNVVNGKKYNCDYIHSISDAERELM